MALHSTKIFTTVTESQSSSDLFLTVEMQVEEPLSCSTVLQLEKTDYEAVQTKYNTLMKYRYKSLSFERKKKSEAYASFNETICSRLKSQSKAQREAVFKSMC